MKTDIIIGTDSRGKIFSLPLEITTATIAILAIKGKGKTYLSDVINEELMKAGQIPIVIDYTGAHWGLKSSADGRRPAFPIVIFGGEHADIPLEENAGELIASAIVESRQAAILDVSLLRKGPANRFLGDFMETLYRLNREPIMLVCDEADAYAPQKPFGDQARTLGAIEDIVRRGRIRGIGCTLITQRPSVINKNVLTQCEILMALGMSHPRDIDAIKEWIDVHGDSKTAKEMIQSLPALPRGTSWFWAPSWDLFDRVKVRPRETFDSSATPKPGQAIQRPQQIAQIDIAALGKQIAATAARVKENDPATLHTRIRDLEKQLAGKAAPAAAKVEYVDRPMLSKQDREEIKKLGETVRAANSEIGAAATKLEAIMYKVEADIRNFDNAQDRFSAPLPKSKFPATDFLRRRPAPASTSAESGAARGDDLPSGEQKILIACVQYAKSGGVTREQLTALTGYKKSSRDQYIKKLLNRGLVERNGERIRATVDAARHLGPNDVPLPTGDALRAYQLARIPLGERKILEVVIGCFPEAVSRDAISQATGYKKSSRDQYIKKLRNRELIETPTFGDVRASETLFT